MIINRIKERKFVTCVKRKEKKNLILNFPVYHSRNFEIYFHVRITLCNFILLSLSLSFFLFFFLLKLYLYHGEFASIRITAREDRVSEFQFLKKVSSPVRNLGKNRGERVVESRVSLVGEYME